MQAEEVAQSLAAADWRGQVISVSLQPRRQDFQSTPSSQRYMAPFDEKAQRHMAPFAVSRPLKKTQALGTHASAAGAAASSQAVHAQSHTAATSGPSTPVADNHSLPPDADAEDIDRLRAQLDALKSQALHGACVGVNITGTFPLVEEIGAQYREFTEQVLPEVEDEILSMFREDVAEGVQQGMCMVLEYCDKQVTLELARHQDEALKCLAHMQLSSVHQLTHSHRDHIPPEHARVPQEGDGGSSSMERRACEDEQPLGTGRECRLALG